MIVDYSITSLVDAIVSIRLWIRYQLAARATWTRIPSLFEAGPALRDRASALCLAFLRIFGFKSVLLVPDCSNHICAPHKEGSDADYLLIILCACFVYFITVSNHYNYHFTYYISLLYLSLFYFIWLFYFDYSDDYLFDHFEKLLNAMEATKCRRTLYCIGDGKI